MWQRLSRFARQHRYTTLITLIIVLVLVASVPVLTQSPPSTRAHTKNGKKTPNSSVVAKATATSVVTATATSLPTVTPTPGIDATPTSTPLPVQSPQQVTPTPKPALPVPVQPAATPTPKPTPVPVPQAPVPTPTPVPPPPTPTPVVCNNVTLTGTTAQIMGDPGESGAGKQIGYITTQLSVTVVNVGNKCKPTDIKQTNYIGLNGNFPETNGPVCMNDPHTCGSGGTIKQYNVDSGLQLDGSWSTTVVYGIWGGPWGPRGLYAADDPNPLSVVTSHGRECAIADGFYQDNYGILHYTSVVQGGDVEYCWAD